MTKEVSIKIEFSVDQLNLVVAALRKLPHEVVDDLVRKIISDAQDQINNDSKESVTEGE